MIYVLMNRDSLLTRIWTYSNSVKGEVAEHDRRRWEWSRDEILEADRFIKIGNGMFWIKCRLTTINDARGDISFIFIDNSIFAYALLDKPLLVKESHVDDDPDVVSSRLKFFKQSSGVQVHSLFIFTDTSHRLNGKDIRSVGIYINWHHVCRTIEERIDLREKDDVAAFAWFWNVFLWRKCNA